MRTIVQLPFQSRVVWIIVLLQLILVVVKIDQPLHASWASITAPLWVYLSIAFLAACYEVVTNSASRSHALVVAAVFGGLVTTFAVLVARLERSITCSWIAALSPGIATLALITVLFVRHLMELRRTHRARPE